MRFPHLSCTVSACVVVLAFLLIGREVAVQLEHHTLRATAPKVFALKNHGTAFQRVAAEASNVLPVYGSSELTMGPPSLRASEFFSGEPAGFQVSPIGKPGATSIIILQKLAALGSELKGKKVAISLSPSWFLVPVVEPYMYRGNFSLFAAGQMAFGNSLDFQLKRDIAARMLEFPQTLAQSPVLEFAIRRLASGKWSDRIAFAVAWPIGKLQNVILDLQDHFAAMIYILRQVRAPKPVTPQTLDWAGLIERATSRNLPVENERAENIEPQLVTRGGDAGFLARLEAAHEWADLEMLLRVLREIRARAILLSMPLDGRFYDQAGVSGAAREAYYAKIRALAERYHVPLVEFKAHDDDPDFLDEHHYHLAAKGWLFYDRALADFYSQPE